MKHITNYLPENLNFAISRAPTRRIEAPAEISGSIIANPKIDPVRTEAKPRNMIIAWGPY